MASINEIEGVGKVYATKLKNIGISTVSKLLEMGKTRLGRKSISESTKIENKTILKWVNMADLFRIKGIAGEIAELLVASGVNTIKELRNRNPKNLYDKIVVINQEKKLVRKPPTLNQITKFILQAKEIDPMITY